jgi:hypothetical protein
MIRLAGVAAFLALLAGGAEAADYYAPAPVVVAPVAGQPPLCSEPWVLSRVADRVDYGERHVWHSVLEVEAIDQIRESASRWPYDSQIARRYCRGTALLNDGSTPYVFYMIETHQGFAGQGADVTACIASRDRWRVYDAACRTVRP